MEKLLIYPVFRYYYLQLNEGEKSVYDAIVSGVLAFEKSIKIRSTTRNKIEKILEYIKLDIPEIFFIERYSMLIRGNSVVGIHPQYLFDKEMSSNILAYAEEEVSQLRMNIANLSDFNKEKEIHDYLLKKTVYKDVDKPYSHEMPGALLYGISVCEGMAKAYKFIADRVGLLCVCVFGEVHENGKKELHAWNKVKVENAYYNVDVTFDQNLSEDLKGHIRYDYFNVSDDIMSDREEFHNPPHADMCCGIYEIEGLYAISKSILTQILEKNMRTQKWFSFQLPKFSVPSEEIYNIIVDEIKRVIQKKEPFGAYTINVSPNYKTGIYSVLIEY